MYQQGGVRFFCQICSLVNVPLLWKICTHKHSQTHSTDKLTCNFPPMWTKPCKSCIVSSPPFSGTLIWHCSWTHQKSKCLWEGNAQDPSKIQWKKIFLVRRTLDLFSLFTKLFSVSQDEAPGVGWDILNTEEHFFPMTHSRCKGRTLGTLTAKCWLT